MEMVKKGEIEKHKGKNCLSKMDNIWIKQKPVKGLTK